MATKFNYDQIQGVKGNGFVNADFIKAVEKMSDNLKTKPEYVLAAMSFETGGTFDPSIQNAIGATGLIQFLKSTAIGLGTTTAALKVMSAVEQLKFVEKYFNPFKGKLDTLEAVYTAILSGSPKKPDDVLFKAGTPAYKLNPLDWNKDGKITAAEATTIVGARLFGGVKAVQQKLLDLGFVPENLQGGFADGRWGENTSKVLAKFQKSKNLPETGLMNEETGSALFPNLSDDTKTTVLKRGDEGDNVKKLQDVLVELGYMTTENISGGYGKYGPQTEKAVQALQKHLGFSETGKYDALEQMAVKTISEGIKRGSSAIELVKVLQNRLVVLKYMTQIQVDTGFGTFGMQTEAAVKKFQKENLLPESGVVEKVTFGAMMNQSKPGTAEKDVFIATNGEHYDVATDILMTKALEKKLAEVAKIYFEEKKKKLFITSGYRPPERQAPAIYDNIVRKGELRVRNTYSNRAAIDQILAAYRANKNNRQKAIEAMIDTIAKQVSRGVFISRHLLSSAIDIRVSADFKFLGKAAAKVGGRVITEGDHFHMELP